MTAGLAPAGTRMELRDLLGELGDLKRIRSAGRAGSIAERGFVRAWGALVAGQPPQAVMQTTVASALAAARLGDVARDKLLEVGLQTDEADAILCRAFDDVVASSLDCDLVTRLRSALTDTLVGDHVPLFVASLASQPRAGATCPGKRRLMLEPAENHAEHCWAVAVFGVLLSPEYNADSTIVFLAGLSHHLHNAYLPDSGLTGEMLLGEHLELVCAATTTRALDQIGQPLRSQVVAARAILQDATTPEGRAFHAADVIDRVLQLAQHLRPARITMRELLDDWKLVHAGPVKSFHESVLVEMGLA